MSDPPAAAPWDLGPTAEGEGTPALDGSTLRIALQNSGTHRLRGLHRQPEFASALYLAGIEADEARKHALLVEPQRCAQVGQVE